MKMLFVFCSRSCDAGPACGSGRCRRRGQAPDACRAFVPAPGAPAGAARPPGAYPFRRPPVRTAPRSQQPEPVSADVFARRHESRRDAPVFPDSQGRLWLSASAASPRLPRQRGVRHPALGGRGNSASRKLTIGGRKAPHSTRPLAGAWMTAAWYRSPDRAAGISGHFSLGGTGPHRIRAAGRHSRVIALKPLKCGFAARSLAGGLSLPVRDP